MSVLTLRLIELYADTAAIRAIRPFVPRPGRVRKLVATLRAIRPFLVSEVHGITFDQ